jgi:hypothetical protein
MPAPGSQSSAAANARAMADKKAREKGYKSDIDMNRAKIAEREAAAKTEKAQVREQLAGDRNRALGMYDEFSQDRRERPVAADRIYAEQEGNAPKIEAGDPGAMERAQAAYTMDPQRAEFDLKSGVERVRADDVTAPKIGPTAQAGASGASASQINDAQGQAVRYEQLDHAKMLKDAAQGNAPSVAEAQLNKALGRVAGEQYGMVAQTRGTERAGHGAANGRSGR